MTDMKTLPRRQFLIGAAAAGLAAAAPTISLAAMPKPTHQLRLVNAHTQEHFNQTILVNGKVDGGALREFRAFARDHYNGKIHDIDARVVVTLCYLQDLLDAPQPLTLLSGYRSPETNAMLRRNSSGVAANSLHLRGMAMDLAQPGRTTSQLHRAAVSLRRGGVGKYSSSGFVHVDSGGLRYWGS